MRSFIEHAVLLSQGRITKKGKLGSESSEQKFFVAWVRTLRPAPLCTFSCGGTWFSPGERINATAIGYQIGCPDLLFFEKSEDGRYNGLAIEMKTQQRYTAPSRAQVKFMSKLRDCSWKTCVCRGWEEAAHALISYFQ